MPQTSYQILGVDETATGSEIRIAYRRLARELHPDRPYGNHAAMVDLNIAYETLSDPSRRAAYDAELAAAAQDRFVDAGTRPPPVRQRWTPAPRAPWKFKVEAALMWLLGLGYVAIFIGCVREGIWGWLLLGLITGGYLGFSVWVLEALTGLLGD